MKAINYKNFNKVWKRYFTQSQDIINNIEDSAYVWAINHTISLYSDKKIFRTYGRIETWNMLKFHSKTIQGFEASIEEIEERFNRNKNTQDDTYYLNLLPSNIKELRTL